MAVYNAFTGLRRGLPKRQLNWKVRSTHSSTVSARMHGKEAMKAHSQYLRCAQNCLLCSAVLLVGNGHNSPDMQSVLHFLPISGGFMHMKARRMIQLESDLLDTPDDFDPDQERFHKELVDTTLDTFLDDNECEVETRPTKSEITLIIGAIDLPDTLRACYHNNQHFKFDSESLLIYMLRKWSAGRTHQEMSNEFGGDPSGWSRGHKFLVHWIDDKYCGLIGPEGLRKWAPCFPQFSEDLRCCMNRDKERVNCHDGRRCVLTTTNHCDEGTFNVMSFTDCKVCEVCRPGSGPELPPVVDSQAVEHAIDRRPGWHIKQRAFYDGFHRAFEACLKTLTMCSPNGLTAAVYGPTSGRRDDRTCFYLSEFDEFLHDICVEFHAGDLYCACGDGIFAGDWFCCRSRHVAPPEMELAQWQKEENLNMKSARVSVEWSHAKAEQLFPMLNNKMNCKIDQNPTKCFAETRAMHFFTNLKVCCAEGSTVTGHRGFRSPPPSAQDYLDMLSD